MSYDELMAMTDEEYESWHLKRFGRESVGKLLAIPSDYPLPRHLRLLTHTLPEPEDLLWAREAIKKYNSDKEAIIEIKRIAREVDP